ncbi:MAG: phosphoribosyltransferase family protein [Candidatus Gracilibacteria bacterium]|nr:phosphoribosyltransferase family protein [Candidatus Gracilibacteria bacterium]
MSYKFQSLQTILNAFEGGLTLGATEIAEITGKSTVIVHKYLKELVIQKRLIKVGIGPRVKYTPPFLVEQNEQIPETPTVLSSNIFGYYEKELLVKIFFKFSPEGKILSGFDGIQKWCLARGLDTEQKITSYIDIYKHIEGLRNDCGLIDAKESFGHDFHEVFLDTVYYADQYKWMDFGRGRLAEMTFYAKLSQNKKLLSESIDEVIHKIDCLVSKEKYDAIAIVPWSIDRKNQLLKILKHRLKSLNIPFVNIIKYSSTGILMPQKTLKTREQRIQNAKNTIFVDDTYIQKYASVLLIDDFVGSGSTLNETARKLKEVGIKRVDGFAFVGNLNLTYEVINEI